MKRILILHTGGTISMQTDQHGAINSSSVNPLVRQPLQLAGEFSLIQEELFNLPSLHMTPTTMLTLAQRIQTVAQNYDGIVVTHGTDTLEETAYFLDLTLHVDCPVVVTGAMRSSDQTSADGPANIRSATLVAASKKATNQGVMVVLNDQIFAARFVTKTHATNLATFQAPLSGPIGAIVDDKVHFFTRLPKQEVYPINHVTKKLYLLKAFAGMNGDLLELIEQAGVNGLVIEGFGAGNLPPAVLPALKQLIADQVPVALVSRSVNGSVAPIYAYEGGAKQLQALGVILSHNLNGQKALIRMQIGLSAGMSGTTLANYLKNEGN
ncbi:asparaginase [Paucilactobacillus hokkaidonensis JCM 18461]|uniref:asparaginase n=2 Tax=Paucilactobacillus hokkaidonensis TaxID=1193095 RepID=A0A0A1GWB7_9LACO|nr:asparaginase [Paucilactobacillus hokkaidonensis]KRO10138.1 asparaginase [Paucilactobacillus hokkaidonensis]BAP85349.1 asparaginase [Paucilactobacillus hokkaidonensis JCM 18461]